MLKKTITYDDYEGNSVTKDFYFNISRAEFMELEMSADPSFSQVMNNIIKSEDRLGVLQGMKKLIRWAYGEKIGDDFIKDERKAQAFTSTEAYSQLLIDLCNDAAAAAEFVKGIAPKGLLKEVDVDKHFTDVELPPDDGPPAWVKENRTPTEAELVNAPRELLVEAMRRKNAEVTKPE